MDEFTKHNSNLLLSQLKGIPSFVGSDSGIKSCPLVIFKCKCNKSFSIEFVSEGISLFGFSSSDVIKNNYSFSDFLSEKDFQYFSSLYKRSCDEKESDFFGKFSFINYEHKLINVYIHTNIRYANNIPKYIECIVVDITNENESYYDLKKISSVINSNDILFVQQKPFGENQYKTQFISNNLNYYGLEDDFLSSSDDDFFSLLVPEDKEYNYLQLKNINVDGVTCLVKTYRMCPSPDVIIWTVFETFVYCSDGKIDTIETIVHDVSEQKEFSIKLYESQKNLTNNLKHNQLISEILKLLQVTDDYISSLKILLQKLAPFIDVSVLQIFIPFVEKKSYVIYSYNCENETFKQREMSFRSLEKRFPNILARLKNYGTAYCDGYGCSKGCLKEFRKYSKCSHLIYTISLGTEYNGLLAITDKNSSRIWNNEIISLVSDISQIVTGLFHRFLTQQELLSAKDTFQTVLDNIDSFVCVTTTDTNEIIFTNKKFNDNFKFMNNMKHCWDVLLISKEEFMFANEKCNYRELNHPHFCEIFCPATNQWLDITEMSVIWNNGNLVKLYTMNDITQKVQYEELIEQQAYNDHLTGLPNRRKLESDFPKMLDDALNSNGFGYILFLDLDNFKNVNDGLGHEYGDELLQNIARFLESLEFTGKTTYRFGGDEFIILISHEHFAEFDSIVQTLLDRFRTKWEIKDTYYFCTMSMGIAKYPYDGTNLMDILKKVDMAMYSAKKQGKNRVIHFKRKIGHDSIRTIELERYLRESVNNDCHGFMVYYQPVIHAQTQKLEGAEALLRWNCENFGFISPAEFIPMAESLGLIVQLGDFVLRQACTECKRWISKGMPEFKMNVNLSVGQLIEYNIVDKISDIIIDVGIPFSNIAFEVTESLAINDMEKMKSVLHSIAALGIEISLDDFGTGYSSLNNIKEMPLNTIKIDKSFIDDLITSSSTEIFVRTIIDLAHALEMRVCAEGVELENQYLRLVELHADIIQGYYFGKPIPADEFEQQFNLN